MDLCGLVLSSNVSSAVEYFRCIASAVLGVLFILSVVRGGERQWAVLEGEGQSE